MNMINDDMHYEKPSDDWLYNEIQFLIDLIEEFITIININKNSIRVSKRALLKVIADTDIDLQSCKIFHDTYPCESFEISRLAYYFLRRKPIILVDESEHDSINEEFCAFLLLKGIKQKTSTEYVRFLMYMLRNGEFTKDGLYTIVRTIELLKKEE